MNRWVYKIISNIYVTLNPNGFCYRFIIIVQSSIQFFKRETNHT